MTWLLGGAILSGVGVLLRQLLGGNTPTSHVVVRLDRERTCVYEPIALELETQSDILAVSLNDAMEERDSGNLEIAFRLLTLTLSEWDRLSEILTLLLRILDENLPLARIVVPLPSMDAADFKSDTMIDYPRLHELLSPMVPRSRLRFHLQVRVLQHAVEALTDDFRRAHPPAYPSLGHSAELWKRLDSDFHDFDLITKETLLTLQTFLACLPITALESFAAELRPLVERGVRSGRWASTP
jgi:hypothetical protein